MEKERLHYELCGITHQERFVWEIGLLHDTVHHAASRDPFRFETILGREIKPIAVDEGTAVEAHELTFRFFQCRPPHTARIILAAASQALKKQGIRHYPQRATPEQKDTACLLLDIRRRADVRCMGPCAFHALVVLEILKHLVATKSPSEVYGREI